MFGPGLLSSIGKAGFFDGDSRIGLQSFSKRGGGTASTASLPINGHFLNSSQNEFGYNFGGGVTRKIIANIEFYAEFRFMHGSHGGITTDLRPITVGVRW